MDFFQYQHDQLMVENLPVKQLAEEFGTPLYVYSKATLERHWHAFNNAFGDHPHLVCFAVKSNPNIAILNIMAKLGSGFDIVSQGELERVLAAGGEAHKVVFSGVAKSRREIARALEVGIRCFNVESEAELLRINQVAGDMGKIAPISLRVNPDVDAHTHPYISTGLKENKFGVSVEQAREVYKLAATLPNIDIVGMDCHIGSQLTELQPFLDAADRLIVLMEQLKQDGIQLKHLDLGGGLGVTYTDETPPHPTEYAKALWEKLSAFSELEIIVEPGRAITANAGILVTKVEYVKSNESRNFAIVDAGMNDMIRPALYQAYMNILEIDRTLAREEKIYDVVGPICETSDFLGKQRKLAIAEGDYLAQRSAGAYGASMSSNYNSRPRTAEVMVDGDNAYLIRRRETLNELWQLESMLP
ncbi:diaminopimelate decarboxylase [Aggregatibacter actinomycetemcomitans serotype e str. SC1083]|uniref:Diaminopimelate decarboxylase n=1 Tax=Aggregatibacter actinomycetemcomitans serotype e str. SC1083 TaxID=907488 RepID=G4A9D6_AGGAC|nr:diaminopimelate decarboxylase [Aggregatibacter actinomycetemcomitans]EGY33482.1 diaminopimelate decarboxylase [Aggregatibacter actinomycetemcomitans serotype e str. SC1083]KYK76790.1 diaminopimelate decarboxylase [Aggregatibacter actinomycetemcomitans serotype e str. SA3096]KYK80388.1 diaminopimelate decarboxylase [Aggregatibacter actinomycetemcomitans serotype e str. SC936]KYK95325.1 diaminopimelate decarboxylase [Aggregatibacter actinomycetemcomitans serotype e str. ANH9776]TYB21420.1 dia